ncbi:hypothetical protein J437_LFUL010158 [Ladona fulva]|uniref:Fatty acyl-CoA reductase n=1 Tax=Ladona fulva TaxID=123851 RepID=A0A8K0P2F2_LADFU|nr:hypothetical protein J437_LFUL010158 [Ladona fulva]
MIFQQGRCGLSVETAAKVVVVEGDISAEGLALSEEDIKALTDADISVVFHSAATVRFNEKLKGALQTNVGGTNEVLRLCRRFRKLKVLVYISTAYSNCNRPLVEEKVYHSEIPPLRLIECAKWMDNKLLDNLAEGPTIVVNSVEEPSPGWTNSLNGPAGVTVGSAVGLVRTILCNESLKVDIVPVDWVVNAVIASAWDVAYNKKQICVYNYTSGNRNPITWREYMENCEIYGHEFPPENPIWYYSLTLTKRKWIYNILRILLHICPAIAVDFICSIYGKEKRLLSIYEKVDEFADLSSFFTMNQWTFHERNITDLIGRMSSEDKVVFPFNIERLSWKPYFRNYMYGLRKYLLKEDPKSIPTAVKRIQRLRFIHRLLKLIPLLILFLFILHMLRVWS